MEDGTRTKYIAAAATIGLIGIGAISYMLSRGGSSEDTSLESVKDEETQVKDAPPTKDSDVTEKTSKEASPAASSSPSNENVPVTKKTSLSDRLKASSSADSDDNSKVTSKDTTNPGGPVVEDYNEDEAKDEAKDDWGVKCSAACDQGRVSSTPFFL